MRQQVFQCHHAASEMSSLSVLSWQTWESFSLLRREKKKEKKMWENYFNLQVSFRLGEKREYSKMSQEDINSFLSIVLLIRILI